MADANKDDIIARLSLDDERFKKGLKEAVNASKQAGKDISSGLAFDEAKLKKATDTLSKSIKGVKYDLEEANKRALEGQKRLEKTISNITTAAVAAGTALAGIGIAAGNRALDNAAKLDDLSQQAGISAEKIQILRYAFSQNGVEIGKTDAALGRFSVTVGNAATMGGSAGEIFKAMGVNIRDANGNIRPTTEILNDTIAALARVKSASERQALAAQLFGKQAGPAMAKLLGEGIDGINRYEDELRSMGGLMSEGMIKKAAEADSQFKALKAVLKSTFEVGVLESYTDAFGEFTNMAKDPALAQAFHGLGQLIGDIASGLLKAVTLLGDLYQKARDGLSLLGGAMGEEPLQKRSEELLEQINYMRKLAPYAKDQEAHQRKLNMLIREREGIIGAMGRPQYFEQTSTHTSSTTSNVSSPLLMPQTGPFEDGIGKIGRATDKVKKSADDMGDAFADAFSGVLGDISRSTSELRSFGDVARSVLQSIVKSEGFKNSVLTPLTDFFSNGISMLFGGKGGARSGGGPVNAGMSYLVGENGPERLFMGKNSGYVVPATQRGGGGQINNTYIYNNSGAKVSTQERTNTSGGRDLMVTIDEMVSGILSDPASRSSRALRKTSGLRPSLTTR